MIKSKPEIPKNVLDKIGELADWYNADPFRTLEDVVAHAILAERDRALEEAAAVADARSQIDPDEDNIDPYDEWEIGMRVSAASIAHAIRALKETP